jgi:HlyD family secretion protein
MLIAITGGMAILTLAFATWRWGAGGGADDHPAAYTVERRDFSVTLLEKGELRAAKSVDIRCEVEGRSTIIWLIEEGTEVKKGDLLVRMASDQIEDRLETEVVRLDSAEASKIAAQEDYEIQLDQNASDIRKAELAVRLATIELEKYKQGDWKQFEKDAELEIERATESLRQAKETLKDSEELYAKQFISKIEYWRDSFDVLEAEQALEKARLASEILHKYTDPQNLAKKESDLHEAEQELKRVKKSAAARAKMREADRDARIAEWEIVSKRVKELREQLANCEIRAPAPGLVVYYRERHRWGSGDEIKEGSEIRERQAIITLPDTSQMVVDVRIHESSTAQIREGLPVTVEVEGVPDRVFAGTITKVASVADSQNRWLNPDLKEYATEITLEPTDADLKPGVTARAEIHIESVTDALAVPVQAVFSRGTKHYVFRASKGTPEPVEVQLGATSSDFAQIIDGLAAGDQILLAVSDDAKRELPEPEVLNGIAAPPVAQRPAEARTPRNASRTPGQRPGHDASRASGRRPPQGGQQSNKRRSPREGTRKRPST